MHEVEQLLLPRLAERESVGDEVLAEPLELHVFFRERKAGHHAPDLVVAWADPPRNEVVVVGTRIHCDLKEDLPDIVPQLESGEGRAPVALGDVLADRVTFVPVDAAFALLDFAPPSVLTPLDQPSAQSSHSFRSLCTEYRMAPVC